MSTLTWEAATARLNSMYGEMRGWNARMAVFLKGAAPLEATAAYWQLEEVVPFVRELVERLERHRQWEGEEWYPLAHAYCEKALVPHTDALFDAAEEAEVLVLCFGKAFLQKMESFPMPPRWEQVQNARALLQQMHKALGDFVRQEGELPAPVGA